MGFASENRYYSMKHPKKDQKLFSTKLTKKIPDLRNANEHSKSPPRKKNTKQIKRTKIITYQPKPIESPKIIDIKSVTKEHPKTSHKFSKTISRAVNVRKWCW